MKAKLIKDHQEYMLINDKRFVIATTDVSILEVTDKMKLSKQNCDEIFGVVDVDVLATEHYKEYDNLPVIRYNSFTTGFNKAMELNKDKMFTLEEVMLAWDAGVMSRSILDMFSGGLYAKHLKEHRDSYRQSLQQPTEIEVEIEMEKVVDETKIIGAIKGVKGSGDKITTYKTVPKLDSEGCLILKKI
jgi:hypothetical protein